MSICFITTHPNPASHFVRFVEVFEEKKIPYIILTGKNVSDKFSQLQSNVTIIDPEKDFLTIEEKLNFCSVIITDIANERFAELFEMLSKKYPYIKRAVYYDNPEQFVPGGYSTVAAKIIEKAQIILFSNSSHVKKGIQKDVGAPIDLSDKTLIGVGYYPTDNAKEILGLRNNRAQVNKIRSLIFQKNKIEERNKKIFVYIGGANEIYYKKAFPHFVSLVSNLIKQKDSSLKDTVIILQQHPRSKNEGNVDAKLIEEFLYENKEIIPKGFDFIVSDMPTNNSLAIANGVFYYQTSMAPQFVLAKIPLVVQAGHETFLDLLVKAGFPSVTRSDELSRILSQNAMNANVQVLIKELGIEENWGDNLLEITKEPVNKNSSQPAALQSFVATLLAAPKKAFDYLIAELDLKK